MAVAVDICLAPTDPDRCMYAGEVDYSCSTYPKTLAVAEFYFWISARRDESLRKQVTVEQVGVGGMWGRK